MVQKAFDYIMGEPVYGKEDSGTLPLILTISYLIIILFILMRIHCVSLPSALYYSILVVIMYGGGRLYRDVFKSPEVSLMVSSIMVRMTFKTVVPILLFFVPLRLQSVKVLNAYQLGKVTLVGLIMYAVNLSTLFIVIYCLYDLSFHWELKSMVVLCIVVVIFQPELTIERLESQGGHVKYLQALLKTEILGEMLMAFTVLDIVMKTEYSAVFYQPEASFVALVTVLQFSGCLIGFVVGVSAQVLASYAFGDPVVSPTLAFPLVFFVYSTAELCLMSGSAAVLTYSVVVTIVRRPRMLQAHELFMQHVWRTIYVVLVSGMMGVTGFILGAVDKQTDIRLFCFAFAIFAVSVMSRFLYCFLILQYLYVGRPKWKELTLAVIGPYRGVSTIILALRYGTTDTDESLEIFVISTLIVLMSIFLNVILLEWFIERLDILHLTKAQISNMNAAVDQINKCRGNMIFAEKLDRFIADANWAVVSRITAFAHPYKDRFKTSEFADAFKDEVKTVQCPRCGDWTVAPPTKKEIDEMLRETQLRVLKAQQVSFQKQREAGTLTVNGYKFLSNLVYQASFSDDLTVNTDDLRISADDLKCVKKVKRWFEKIDDLTTTKYEWQPTNKCRLKCFRTATSQTFKIIMALMSLFDMFICLSFAYLFATTMPKGGKSWPSVTFVMGLVVSVVMPLLYVVNILESAIQILGLGVMQYFSKRVYKVEFLSCVVMRTLQIVLYFSECWEAHTHLNFIHVSPAVVYMNCLLVLRVTRFYIFFVSIIPFVQNRIQNTIDNDLLRRYDVGNAYLVSLDRVLKYLSQIATNDQVLDEVRRSVEADRQKLTKELAVIQKEHPNVAITVKTKHAIRHVINQMGECASAMQTEGILDTIEYTAISKSIHKVQKKLYKLSFIAPPLPINIMKEILWLQGDCEHTELFLAEAVMYNYDYNDVLLRNGEDPVGLYILVSGLLKALYVPSPTSVQLANKFGVLPNYDFFENFKFDQAQEELIVSGNVVGELGLVTGRRYDMTVIADTAAQVYFIPDIVMKTLHDTYSGQMLLGKIWKKIAVRVSMTLLQFTNTYRHWNTERLMMFLQRGVMLNLAGIEAVNIDPKVEEAILIEGVAMDVNNRNIIYGPYQISKTATKLLLPEHKDWDFQTVYGTRLFLIMTPGANAAELLETVSDFRFSPENEELPDKEPSEEKPKKKVDRSKKVGFTEETEI